MSFKNPISTKFNFTKKNILIFTLAVTGFIFVIILLISIYFIFTVGLGISMALANPKSPLREVADEAGKYAKDEKFRESVLLPQNEITSTTINSISSLETEIIPLLKEKQIKYFDYDLLGCKKISVNGIIYEEKNEEIYSDCKNYDLYKDMTNTEVAGYFDKINSFNIVKIDFINVGSDNVKNYDNICFTFSQYIRTEDICYITDQNSIESFYKQIQGNWYYESY